MPTLKKVALIAAVALVLVVSFALFSTVGAQKKTTTSSKGSAAEGKKVFAADCQMCHTTEKDTHGIGPTLYALFKNRTLPSSHKPVTEENVRDQVLKGSPDAKPMPMPGFKGKLKPEQVNSLILYLKTL